MWSLIPNNTKRRYGFAATRVSGGNKKKNKCINKVHLARKSYDFIEEKYRDMVREAVYEIMGSMCDYKTVAEGDRNIYANTENSKEDILVNLNDDPYKDIKCENEEWFGKFVAIPDCSDNINNPSVLSFVHDHKNELLNRREESY